MLEGTRPGSVDYRGVPVYVDVHLPVQDPKTKEWTHACEVKYETKYGGLHENVHYILMSQEYFDSLVSNCSPEPETQENEKR